MAKKSRRARRRRAQRVVAVPKAQSVRKEEERVEPTGPTRATGIDLGEQYGYVYDDLKRIAILAAAMFAILILLSFIIR